MSNVGDFAVQNPIVCRCRLNVECGMGNVECVGLRPMWNGEWGMGNEGDFAVQNPIV